MQNLDEAIALAKKPTGPSSRVLYDVDLSECGDSLVRIIVKTNCDENYRHRENFDGDHNSYVHFVHRGEQLPYLSAVRIVANPEAQIPQHCTGEHSCGQHDGKDIYIPTIHCGFEAATLDAGVKKVVKEAIDTFSNRRLIKPETAAKAYVDFKLAPDMRSHSLNEERDSHARY